MRLMLAALVATSVIAIVAAVFAIWPVVADAPWESDDPVVVVQPTVEQRSERCRRTEQAYLDALVEGANRAVIEYLNEETNRFC